MARRKARQDDQAQVLLKSRRRCAFCFGLDGDLSEKKGQIAHIDRDPFHSHSENLAYLCFRHHDQYDSTTSQSKRLTPDELRAYRDRLYEQMSADAQSPLTAASGSDPRRVSAVFRDYLKVLENGDFSQDSTNEPAPVHLPLLPQVTWNVNIKQPSVWLQPHRRMIPMSYRDAEIRSLREFTEGPGTFRWRVLIGESGVGKTRLGLEFAIALKNEGWHVSMPTADVLSEFVGSTGYCKWRPSLPTFVVIDYAASKGASLRKLLQRMAEVELESSANQYAVTEQSAIRVLLLERHADESHGWLNDLLCCCEGQIRDILQNSCYQGLTEILPPLARSSGRNSLADGIATGTIITETFKSWNSEPGRVCPQMPVFSDSDWQRIQINTGNRPLYVQMAALHACEIGSADSLPLWGRGRLLRAAVNRELDYVKKECGGDNDLSTGVCHLAAILCISGVGLSRDGRWLGIVRNELPLIGIKTSAVEVERYRRLIFGELAHNDSKAETGLIQPDILSEGFAATILYHEREIGLASADTLGRIIDWAGLKGWANLIRMVQDLHGINEFEDIEQWPLSIIEDRSAEELTSVVDIIPERTASLHKFGVRVNELLAQQTAAGSGVKMAKVLVKLAIHRHRGYGYQRHVLERAQAELEQALAILEVPVSGTSSSERLNLLAKAHREMGWIIDDIFKLLGDQELNRRAIRHQVLGALAAVNCYPDDVSNYDVSDIRVVLESSWPEDDRFACEYANCLCNISHQVAAVQLRSELALDVIRRCVEVGEWLASKNWSLYAPDLARYLNNLALRQRDLNHIDEAMENEKRSAQIRAEFVYRNPDQYAEPLTLSLTTLIELQYLKNDNAAAAETSQQLVSVIEELVARDPRRFRRALAQANHNLGYLCYKVRRLEVGLEYTLKGLAIREEIAVQDPELICLDLAWSYHNAGSFYLDLSDVENAITNCRRAFELRRQSMATNPGTFVSKVIDNAKTLADLFQRKGKMDEATHWWQVAVESSADADSMTQAVIGAEHAVFLHTNCSIESAVLAAKMAIKDFRQVLTECDPVQAPAKFAEVASRLCYLLLTVCNWSKDPSLLPEVERVARQAVGLIDPEMDNCRYSWIALVLNRGYALFRQGELESDRQLMTKGIESLDKACTYQLENDVQEASVTDHAKNLAGMYQKVGNIDRAANWWQVAVKSSVGVDATTQGLIEVGHADFLHIIDATEAAIQSAKRAEINFRKVLKECDAQAAPEKYAMAACNVCHSLILIGDWSENPGQLFEAEEIAGRAISLISPEVAVCRYNWGALLHNIGHALYRRGELESNRQLIARGIKSLEEAYNFQEENDMEVADLTAKILEKARRALAS